MKNNCAGYNFFNSKELELSNFLWNFAFTF